MVLTPVLLSVGGGRSVRCGRTGTALSSAHWCVPVFGRLLEAAALLEYHQTHRVSARGAIFVDFQGSK